MNTTLDKLRIAYVISAVSSDNTGMGGHYRSALVLAENMMQRGAAVHIFTLGDIFPAPFRGTHVPVTHIDFDNRLGYYGAIRKAISGFQPTHVHSFDNKSHFFARLVARRLNKPTFLTKPGGPNRRTFFPFSADIIGFSEENLTFLSKRRNLRRTRFHLIPNRVVQPTPNPSKVEELKKRIDLKDDEVVVLRICRIGHYYRQSILQTFRLAERLRQSGVKARAVVVGFIQDQEVYDEVSRDADEGTTIVTDPHFTEKASELLEVADIVVGTGRSFMEAAMQQRLCATPLQGQELPALVTAANFNDLARTNFSERNELANFNQDDNLQEFCRLIGNRTAFDRHTHEVMELVDERFGMSGAARKYSEVYAERSSYVGAPLLDYLGNSLAVLRYYGPLLLRASHRKAAAP